MKNTAVKKLQQKNLHEIKWTFSKVLQALQYSSSLGFTAAAVIEERIAKSTDAENRAEAAAAESGQDVCGCRQPKSIQVEIRIAVFGAIRVSCIEIVVNSVDPDTACNEPGKQETVEDGIKRVRPRVLLLIVLAFVLHVLSEIRKVFDNSEDSTDDKVDRDIVLTFARVKI
jgi:hypothetical protein